MASIDETPCSPQPPTGTRRRYWFEPVHSSVSPGGPIAIPTRDPWAVGFSRSVMRANPWPLRVFELTYSHAEPRKKGRTRDVLDVVKECDASVIYEDFADIGRWFETIGNLAWGAPILVTAELRARCEALVREHLRRIGGAPLAKLDVQWVSGWREFARWEEQGCHDTRYRPAIAKMRAPMGELHPIRRTGRRALHVAGACHVVRSAGRDLHRSAITDFGAGYVPSGEDAEAHVDLIARVMDVVAPLGDGIGDVYASILRNQPTLELYGDALNLLRRKAMLRGAHRIYRRGLTGGRVWEACLWATGQLLGMWSEIMRYLIELGTMRLDELMFSAEPKLTDPLAEIVAMGIVPLWVMTDTFGLFVPTTAS